MTQDVMKDGRSAANLQTRLGATTSSKQFYYVLTEAPCPYLSGRLERKLITEIAGPQATTRYTMLSKGGFRRSHQFAYRPACSGCSACVPVRVDVERFSPSSSLKRVMRVNEGLRTEELPAVATREQYDLFNCYIESRHDDGEMSGMTVLDYHAMVQQTNVDTKFVEFRAEDGRLVAACLFDVLEDGLSAVYSFFDPELSRRSPGTFIVLWLIDAARAAGLSYVYLGYWIRETPKMSYKNRFRPLQALTGVAGWRDIEPAR